MSNQAKISVSIKAAGTPDKPAFHYHVSLNDHPVLTNQTVSAEDAKRLCDFSRAYNESFERKRKPRPSIGSLRGIGTGLFDIWLAGAWDKIAPELPPGEQNLLVIKSDVPSILNLPWEALSPPGGDFVGFDARFSVRRFPWPDKPLKKGGKDLRPGPLRVLLIACAPEDQPQLDFEREEESLLKVLGHKVAFDSSDMGSFDELRQKVNEFQPHIVHMTGHGVVGGDGLGYFVFEDERGSSDPHSSTDIRQMIFAGSGVQCVFVSGCQSGKAPPLEAMGGICQGLVGDEIPMAVGWAASIGDLTATEFARVFYETLAAGRPVDRAFVQARQAIRKAWENTGIPEWTLPVLYCSTDQGLLFDATKPLDMPARPNVVQAALPGMSEGHAEHFVGRRRETQRLLPRLTDGELQTVILTGLGGAGKSTLATRLARKLEAQGFRPIPVPSSQDNPLSAARLIQACGDAFLAAEMQTEHATLNNPEIPVDARLRYIVSALNEGSFALVLDNFEANLDESSRAILDPEIAGFYVHLLENLSGSSRAIVTSRYLPADVGKLPRTVVELSLADFPESSFHKFLMRDAEVERRYYNGELPADLLTELHGLLGGAPRFLIQVREVLKSVSADDLRTEMDAIKLPKTADPGRLQSIRDKYCESIFTARLYGYLSPESQRALSRAAVYAIPIDVEGLAAVTGESAGRVAEFVAQWRHYALAYPDGSVPQSELWSVYGLLRAWLLSPDRISADDLKAAHHAAGGYLSGISEADREQELGLDPVQCLLHARAHYLEAQDYENARRAANPVSDYLMRQGLLDDLVRLNQELFDRDAHPEPLHWIGNAYVSRGEYDAAREKSEQVLEMSRQIGDRKGEATALHQLATIDLDQGDYDAAREKFLKSLEIRQQIGDRAGEAATLAQLANLDILLGDYDAAREKSLKSLEIQQQIGNRQGEAAVWHQLATIDLRQGDYDAAREKFLKSLEIEQQIGDRAGEAAVWHQLASIDILLGDYDAARDKFLKSLEIKQQIGDRAGEAATWHQLATIDLRQGDYDAAREKFLKSLDIKQQIGDRAGEATTLAQLGIMAAENGSTRPGLRLLCASAGILGAIRHADLQRVLPVIAGLASQLGLTKEDLEALAQEATASYAKDRGWSLIREAFGSDCAPTGQ